jgi:hypothetical protein
VHAKKAEHTAKAVFIGIARPGHDGPPHRGRSSTDHGQAFRGVLPALFDADERWRWRPVLAAAALFGLWHTFPSFALTQNATFDTALGGVPVVLVSVLTMLAAGSVDDRGDPVRRWPGALACAHRSLPA